ncbi:MAG: FMN reductase (NADPH) [bacterium ADurb.Bin429]|nr:MAG: FMN reductase (NADPH) [bacterium ADurb.Bin429]
MDALTALRARRSIRRYTDRAVAREDLETLVDCARLAATARNEQPWEFVVVTDAAMRAQLAEICEYGKFFTQAPVVIVVLCHETKYYLEDGAAATQNLLVAAAALGLGTCWVAGDKKPYADTVRALLGAPEGYRVVSHIAVGYAAETPAPAKRPLRDVLHWERY